MYVQKRYFYFLASTLLALLFLNSAIQKNVARAEGRDEGGQLSAQRDPGFRNYWDRFEIYPGRLRPDRALVIADGGSLEFEDRIQCSNGTEVWIHTPLEPQVVLDVTEATRVSIESTNFARSLVVVIADENLNIVSCNNGIVSAQINTLTLQRGTYGVWYGVRVGYRPSRFLHSKLWILN